MATTFAEAFAETVASYTSEQAATEIRRLMAMVIALEAECAALADALGAVTHEFEPDPRPYARAFCTACSQRADSVVHRTAAWVRKRYGFGAT
jgi:hypothetical protein